jgi:phosphohistidine phosphatase
MKSNSSLKTIYLLRHSDAEPMRVATDFERELTSAGKERVKILANQIRQKFDFDHIYYSTSKRTMQTYSILKLDHLPSIGLDKLYLAEIKQLVEILEEIPNSLQSILMIGHNNGLSELATYISSENVYLSTCELMEIQLEIDNWKLISSGIGKVKRNFLPK